MPETITAPVEVERERIASELEFAANNYYPADLASITHYHAGFIRSGLSYDEYAEKCEAEDNAQSEP